MKKLTFHFFFLQKSSHIGVGVQYLGDSEVSLRFGIGLKNHSKPESRLLNFSPDESIQFSRDSPLFFDWYWLDKSSEMIRRTLNLGDGGLGFYFDGRIEKEADTNGWIKQEFKTPSQAPKSRFPASNAARDVNGNEAKQPKPRMIGLMSNPEYLDFKLIGDDNRPVKVSKILLALKCNNFARLFARAGFEDEDDPILTEYEVAGATHDSLKEFWNFILHREFTGDVSLETVGQLVNIGNMFEISQLSNKAEKVMCHHLQDPAKVLRVLSLAHEMGFKEALDSAVKVVCGNKKAFRPEELSTLPKEVIARLFAEEYGK